ncbi:MAG TPA: DeoR/GlpR family DNA-binding transcription regulator [Anaerolineales bacterium]|nr:DeoR/GlpR family DNA-binding transcription regulator [Anaerolineales bacterium]
MDALERQNQIVEIVLSHGRVSIPEICASFGVSEMTARRDLAQLDRQGLVRRYHGGAAANLGRSYEPPFKTRSSKYQEAKVAIGRRAADLVIDGDSIALDVGTTTMEIVPGLAGKRNLTIVTSCLQIANMIVNYVPLEVAARLIVTGGIVRPRELSMIGPIPQQVYEDFHVDKAFIGTAGISVHDGLTEYNIEDTQIKQVLIRSARERIVVADASKLGVTTFATVAPLKSIDKIVTDASASAELVEEIRKQGVEVILAT